MAKFFIAGGIAALIFAAMLYLIMLPSGNNGQVSSRRSTPTVNSLEQTREAIRENAPPPLQIGPEDQKMEIPPHTMFVWPVNYWVLVETDTGIHPWVYDAVGTYVPLPGCKANPEPSGSGAVAFVCSGESEVLIAPSTEFFPSQIGITFDFPTTLVAPRSDCYQFGKQEYKSPDESLTAVWGCDGVLSIRETPPQPKTYPITFTVELVTGTYRLFGGCTITTEEGEFGQDRFFFDVKAETVKGEVSCSAPEQFIIREVPEP